MPESKVISLEERAKDEQKPFLEQLLREGARKLLQAAIENEVIDYIQLHKDRLDENGQRLVVRNGHLPEREVISGAGPIPVVALYLNRRLWPFTALKSWTGGLATGLNSRTNCT